MNQGGLDYVVLDASVGVKWFFKEEGWEKAAFFKSQFLEQQIKIVVPEIFYAELASACFKRVRRKILSTEQAMAYLDEAIDLPLQRYSDHELSDVAMGNALQYRISVYDALYLSLAEIYTSPLITADRALLKACGGRFDFIESLEDFEF